LTINGEPVSVNGGLWTTLLALDEGTNFVSAVARDQVSNVGTAAIEVTLDTRSPVVVIDSPADGFVTNQASVAVAGMINDIVVGTVGGDQAVVTVNGIVAEVANRSFLAASVPLVPGVNTITAVGEDRAGNVASDQITVTFEEITTEARITLVSGNNQTGSIGGLLTQPLVVALEDATGSPVAGENVVFKVIENNGTITTGTASARSLIAVTDAQGLAQVSWSLGTRAGAGNNIVEAVAVGFAGTALFTATGLPAAPDKINLDAGNNQTGAAGEPLPGPFAVAVTDAGHNRLADVPVTFTVVEGDGTFNGLPSITVDTDGNGRALALVTLGPQEGFDNNIVEADFPGNLGLPARFVASGKIAGDPAATRVSGVVLDNTNIPIAGVTFAIEGTSLSVQSDAEGQFTIAGAPVGPVTLHADGGTAQRPGAWPSLEFELVTVAGQDNRLSMPVYLLPLDTANELCVDEVTGGTLTLPEVPGFSLTVAAGSATFLDGSKAGCISVTTVHADKVPMTPNFGQQPRFIITVQPAGVIFDPPAPMILPNTDGLAPGEVTELYSFDHDLGQFVSIGTGTVSGDGLAIVSDSGVGIVKSGWQCGGNPTPTASCEPVDVNITKAQRIFSVGSNFTFEADGSPEPGTYSWSSSNPNAVVIEGSNSSSPLIQAVGIGESSISVEYKAQSGQIAAANFFVNAVDVKLSEQFLGICEQKTKEVNVELQPSPLPPGFALQLDITRVSGSGGAVFEDGTSQKQITESQTIRIRGDQVSSEKDNFLIVFTVDGVAVLPPHAFSVVHVSLDLRNTAGEFASLDNFGANEYERSTSQCCLGEFDSFLLGNPELNYFGFGVEIIGTVTPNDYEGEIILVRDLVSGVIHEKQPADSVPQSTLEEPRDDSSDILLIDANPQSCDSDGSNCSMGTIYDLDAPGFIVDAASNPTFPIGTILRSRTNFAQRARLFENQGLVCSNDLQWFERQSIIRTDENAKGWERDSGTGNENIADKGGPISLDF
jgi:hypothetical protein